MKYATLLVAALAIACAGPTESVQAQRWFLPSPQRPAPQQPAPQQPAPNPAPRAQPESRPETPRAKVTNELFPFVRVTAGNSLGSGTVFFRDAAGNCFVLTNHHVAGQKGSRVGIEFWTVEGELLAAAPGVVVQAEIDDGWTDISIVKISPERMPGDNISPVPIAPQGSRVENAEMVTSCGSPGGSWQTKFVGRTYKTDERRLEFYPRPGGGRSGSGMEQDHQIVGLLTWSSGRPNWEQQSADGMGYRSGYGIAQQVDTIWRVLKGQVSVDVGQRPQHYAPLVHFIHPAAWNVGESADPPQAEDPEDAKLRVLRRMREKGQSDSGDGFRMDDSAEETRLLRGRSEPGPVRQFLSRFLMFAVLVVGLLVLLAYIGRRKGWWMIGFLTLCFPASGCGQDAYNAEMSRLASRWTVEPVSQETRWGSYAAAYEKFSSEHVPMVVLITISNCPACDTLKEQLAKADEFGWLNQAACALVSAESEPRLACELSASRIGYPVLVLFVPERQPDGEYKNHRYVRVGTFPSKEQVEKLLAENADGGLPCPVTLEDYLAGAGVR